MVLFCPEECWHDNVSDLCVCVYVSVCLSVRCNCVCLSVSLSLSVSLQATLVFICFFFPLSHRIPDQNEINQDFPL